MDEHDWKRPAIIGGLIAGIPSVIPFLQMLNVCLCLWAWVGGIVAAKLLIDRSPQIITSKDGARIGLLAGLIGAAIVFVISMLLMYWRMDQVLQVMISYSASAPEAQSFYQRVQDNPTLKTLFAFVMSFIGSIFILGFTILGGLIGVALFEKRRNQSPPPSPYAPNYPPQANYPSQSGGSGSEQGGWPSE